MGYRARGFVPIPQLLGSLLLASAATGCDRAEPRTEAGPRGTSQVAASARTEPADFPDEAEPSASADAAVPPATGGPEKFPAHMTNHLKAVDALRDAIVAGELGMAKEQAKWLGKHPMAPELLTAWKPHFDKMQKAAQAIVGADDMMTAALGFGRMSEACGECHAEFAGPTYKPGKPPLPAKQTKDEMVRHAWAAERMTLAVVTPSDALWNEGTRAFAKSSLPEGELSRGMPDKVAPKISKLAEGLYEFGDPKSEAQKGRSRGEVLGELLATCNACHTLARSK